MRSVHNHYGGKFHEQSQRSMGVLQSNHNENINSEIFSGCSCLARGHFFCPFNLEDKEWNLWMQYKGGWQHIHLLHI
ncbi:hypothetical protein KP509_1Z028700 [Ceratopteris richardii]|nr:hypothetical protein KP509_1Z028700 [Ceratopteris richardii]